MDTMARKKPRARRSFTPEFKVDIVAACQRGDRTIGQVAQDFDLTQTAVRAWVGQAEIDGSAASGATAETGPLTSDGRAELARLRRENRRLSEDVEILKRATAFFAGGLAFRLKARLIGSDDVGEAAEGEFRWCEVVRGLDGVSRDQLLRHTGGLLGRESAGRLQDALGERGPDRRHARPEPELPGE